jgi:shikimate kinase
VPSVILIGPPGAGKSSVAKALAKIINHTVIDTDTEVERNAGKKISDIFVDDGESVFRRLEAEAVLTALQDENAIVSLGGGAVMTPNIDVALTETSAPIVYLEVSISQAAPRVGFNKDRPMLLVNPRQQWLALMEIRRPVYERLASLTFSTDSKKASEVAADIAQALKGESL